MTTDAELQILRERAEELWQSFLYTWQSEYEYRYFGIMEAIRILKGLREE